MDTGDITAEVTLNLKQTLVAQLQTGIVPQAIKTGRSKNTPEQNRPCEMCDLNDVESEYCFILCSTACDDLRESVFNAALR